MTHKLAVAVSLGVTLAGILAHTAELPLPPQATIRYHRVGRSSRCLRSGRGPLVYHYPTRPFLRQHPIRGNFGDPRTLSSGEFGTDTSRTPGSFSFHNGIDIWAITGTPVYPVVSGRATIGYNDEVIVVTGDDRVFQYFHIRPAIRPGQWVAAYRTVLGKVLPHWGHVHLTEIDGFRVHNPADPGHLTPYRDETVPMATRVIFSTAGGRMIRPTALRGQIQIAAQVIDVPAQPIPGAWFDRPVTPVVVSWRLSTSWHRIVVPWRTVVDFRKTEPPNREFWRVYGPGTFQNFPVFDERYFYGISGRYVFRLTRAPLETRRLGNGSYVLDVRTADVCGNWSIRSEPVTVDNVNRGTTRFAANRTISRGKRSSR